MQEVFNSEQKAIKVEGKIDCEKPNNAIYKFEGVADIKQIKN
jgi:hypothetical protein